MSLDGWTLVMDTLAVLVSGFGLGFLAIQIRMARREAEESARAEQEENDRRKRQATIDFYRDTLNFRASLRSAVPDGRDAEGVGQFVGQALETGESVESIRDYLGYYEMLAVGVLTEVLDFATIQRLAGGRIIAIADNYRPYIEARRRTSGSATLYDELETLAGRLRDDREQRLAERPH